MFDGLSFGVVFFTLAFTQEDEVRETGKIITIHDFSDELYFSPNSAVSCQDPFVSTIQCE